MQQPKYPASISLLALALAPRARAADDTKRACVEASSTGQTKRAGGLGVVGLGTFTFFALRASSDLHTLQTTCSPACTQDQTRPGRQSALIADISLGVGVLSLAGAVNWALLSKSQESEARLGAPHVDFQAMAHGGAALLSGSY
jgi:hypothetical protein